MKKVVFCDLDNTLLFPLEPTRYGIKPQDLSAVQQAHQLGVEFVINSGRPAVINEGIANMLGFEVDALGYNGGQLLSKNESIVFASIPTKDYIKITSDVMQRYPEVNCGTTDFSGSYYINDLSREPAQRFRIHYSCGIVKEVCEIPALISLPQRDVKEVAKILFYVKDFDKTEELLDYLNSTYGDSYDFLCSSHLFIEALCKGVTKATGIDEYMKRFALNEEHCYSIGDADNDIEMLKRFPTRSFCMAHGSTNAKNASAYVVSDFAEALKIILNK